MPEDPIFGLSIAFASDPRQNKINLGIGAYQTEQGEPLVLSCVRKAEEVILRKQLNKAYLPIEGDGRFIRCILELLLGNNSPLFQTNNYFAAQTVGGASALRIAGEFLAKLISKTIFISHPTWSNHRQIFEMAGLTVCIYPYFDEQSGQLDFTGLCKAITKMPQGSIILLHGCCHNPTGIDPSFEQWQELSSLIKKQQIIPLFDIAYQGLGDGLDQDAEAIRYFVRQEHELLITYSCSKNFGLYGERAGLLAIVCGQSGQPSKMGSQVKCLIRGNYSNPPLHGARIVSTILSSNELDLEWKAELQSMRKRIQQMRNDLAAELFAKMPTADFSYIKHQKGLFSYSGLKPDQVQFLRQEKGIYMPSSGRINMAGLNAQNIPRVANALLSQIPYSA